MAKKRRGPKFGSPAWRRKYNLDGKRARPDRPRGQKRRIRREARASAQLTAALAAIADGKKVAGVATAPPAGGGGGPSLLPSQSNRVAQLARPFALRHRIGKFL